MGDKRNSEKTKGEKDTKGQGGRALGIKEPAPDEKKHHQGSTEGELRGEHLSDTISTPISI